MQGPDQTAKQQLQMIWPQARLKDPPVWTMPDGYALRTYRPGDEKAHVRLMKGAGFSEWSETALDGALQKCLPGGFFLIVHAADESLVATAMALHNPSERHPLGGELGWVAADSEHKGKGLGYCVCAAATARFLDAGYSDLYLRTDDFRLPAIKTYLKLGWIPFLFAPDMDERWRSVCRQLGLDFGDLDCVRNLSAAAVQPDDIADAEQEENNSDDRST